MLHQTVIVLLVLTFGGGLEAVCPAGWKFHKDSCYNKFNTPTDWFDAELDCEDKGGSLVEIQSAEENDFVSKNFKGPFWIGISRCANDELCFATSFEPPTYTNWATGEPNGSNDPAILNDYAVAFNAAGKWDDDKKSAQKAYVCKKPEDPCKKNNCANGATCVAQNDGSYKCKCTAGFFGEFCEDGPCFNKPCKNDGICTDNGNKYTCQCVNGFTGKDCEVPPPCNAKPCKNGGICTNKGAAYDCTCKPGWIGTNCDQRPPCFNKPCKNGGVCKPQGNTYNCQCQVGWRGKNCDKTPCDFKVCKVPRICVNERNTAKCECKKGWTGANCEKKSWGSGDPHYKTLDGRRYDFMGKCEYIYAKDCGRDHVFEVLQQNEACGGGSVSCTKSARVLIYKKSLEIGLYRGRYVTLNGQHKTMPFTISGVTVSPWGNGARLVSDVGLTVQWNGGMYIEVEIDQRYAGNLCGLAGNADGNPNNDFQKPDKTITKNIAEFGNSWKKNPRCVNGIVPEDPCKKYPNRKLDAVKRCNAMKRAPFQQCNTKITPDITYIPNCQYDICALKQNPSAAWCQALQAYSQGCREHGITITWEGQPGFEECGNPCANVPCSNGAKCENINRKEFKCTCTKGFKGRTCDDIECPAGYQASHGNACYKKMRNARSWKRARCGRGESVVRSENDQESKFIYDTFVQRTGVAYWMNVIPCAGGKLCDNRFRVVLYHNFEGGKVRPRSCAAMKPGKNGKWTGENCRKSRPYLCKRVIF